MNIRKNISPIIPLSLKTETKVLWILKWWEYVSEVLLELPKPLPKIYRWGLFIKEPKVADISWNLLFSAPSSDFAGLENLLKAFILLIKLKL